MRSATIKTKLLLALIALLCCLGLFKIPFAQAQDDATSSTPVDASTSAIADLAESSAATVGTSTETVSTSTPVDVSESSSSPSTPTETASTTTQSNENAPASNDGSSSSPATEPAPAGLKLVHIIGTKYIDYFTDGTTTTAFSGDPQIDAHLAEPNAPTPTHDNLRWDHTSGYNLYDTPSGDLEMGDYALQTNGQYIANAPPSVSSTSTPTTTSTPVSQGNTETSAGATASSTSTQCTSGADATSSSTQGDAATTSASDEPPTSNATQTPVATE
jgi:hypothetical protein